MHSSQIMLNSYQKLRKVILFPCSIIVNKILTRSYNLLLFTFSSSMPISYTVVNKKVFE